MTSPHYTFTSVRANLWIVRVLDALETPMTAVQLAATLHKSKVGVLDYLRHLMAEPRRVYIADYAKSTRGHSPVYALGSLPDAEPPKRKSHSEKYAALIADAEAYAAHLARRRESARLRAGPRVVSTPIPARIKAFLEDHPRSTAREIAERLGVGRETTMQTLQRLRRAGIVRLWTPDRKRRAVHWQLKVMPEMSDSPVRHVQRAWTPTPVKAQNPFSALFMGGAHA